MIIKKNGMGRADEILLGKDRPYRNYRAGTKGDIV